MVGVAHGDGGDAVRLGAGDRVARRGGGEHLADAVMPVDDGDRAGVDHPLGARHGLHDAGLEARHIPGEAQHAMRLMAPQIGLDEAVGEERGVGRRHAALLEDGGGEATQRVGVDG